MIYVLQDDPGRCPKCRGRLKLLAPEFGQRGSIFYVCWDDRIILQAGTGEVRVV